MPESPVATGTDHYDLCIVGAGYAGLNAAFVASRYLPSTARVLVLDKHHQAGGMWNDAYPYVRLHQPHRMFTAGNIPWTLGRERSYLATRDEVAAHLRHCFDVISQRVNVDARWGWECLDHSEDGTSVVVTASAPDEQVTTFTAARFIDAAGFDIESIEPLSLASQQVRSIAPQGLAESGLLSDSDATPVWVIGSGKTAMDTLLVLIRANPARRIGMVTGTGTYFFNRDLVNPTGLKRWIGGVRFGAVFAGAATRFDGTNAAEVGEWCRSHYGISVLADPAPTHTLFSLLSGHEAEAIASGVSEIVRGHLVDVVDDASGPALLLRTGIRHPIPSGSWIVNCTGHLGPRDMAHIPHVSSSGRSMSINMTSATTPNTAISAYLLSQLFFLDKLADAPLYAADFYGLVRNAPEAALPVTSALFMYNFGVIVERVPMKALRTFGLDFDRWYPPMRQLAGQLQLMRTNKRYHRQCQQALDTFSRLTNVRCGPLSAADAARVEGSEPLSASGTSS